MTFRTNQIARLMRRAGQCSHCLAMSVPDHDEDGDMHCLVCGREWMRLTAPGRRMIPIAGGAYSAVAEDTLVARVQAQRCDRPVSVPERRNGKNDRFVGRTAAEITELINEHCPLLNGEIECECLHTFHRSSSPGVRGERCSTCGRCWVVRWDGMLVLGDARPAARAA